MRRKPERKHPWYDHSEFVEPHLIVTIDDDCDDDDCDDDNDDGTVLTMNDNVDDDNDVGGDDDGVDDDDCDDSNDNNGDTVE